MGYEYGPLRVAIVQRFVFALLSPFFHLSIRAQNDFSFISVFLTLRAHPHWVMQKGAKITPALPDADDSKEPSGTMIKILIISIMAGVLVLFAIRLFPKLRLYARRLLQNSFVRSILFRGLWRLIRLILFKN